jgi:NADP-dependent 3-hydroxy acid dehydrogenase YdfG
VRPSTALVTGASRGIGLEVARALAGEGLRVAMLARTRDALEAGAAAIGERALVVPCDLGDGASRDRALAQLRAAFGGAPDVVVNNAGRFPLAPVEATSVEEFVATLEANLVAPFAVVRALVGELRERGRGHVVTIGSIADRTTFPENGAYAASKHGLRALHEVLRAELRGTGVRATLVSPGPVDTALWDAIDPDTRPGFTPRASMLAPTMVAEAVRWAVLAPPSMNVDELRLSRS